MAKENCQASVELPRSYPCKILSNELMDELMQAVAEKMDEMMGMKV